MAFYLFEIFFSECLFNFLATNFKSGEKFNQPTNFSFFLLIFFSFLFALFFASVIFLI